MKSSLFIALSIIIVCSLCIKTIIYFQKTVEEDTIAITQDIPNEETILTFSNTQVLDGELYTDSEATVADIFKNITLPPPPKNNSVDVIEELTLLHAYTGLRTKEKLSEIENEDNIYNAYFGSSTLLKITTEKPNSGQLLGYVLKITSTPLLSQKLLFDRVRPSYLDHTLTTALIVPRHPAYPSGHATQAQLVALTLSALNPQSKSTYVEAAERIAKNREVAGIHYPSDSTAGKLLAEQLFNILSETEDFQEKVSAAKADW